jgi:DNA modification methylase
MTQPYQLHHGDCLETLRGMADNSIDAIVTDPPAGIAFMNKAWDKDKGGKRQWIAWMQEVATECLRVLKPGGHALVWALPRTSHWTADAWEEAGWEPRDCIYNASSSSDKMRELIESMDDTQLKLFMTVFDASKILATFGSGFPKSLDIGKSLAKAAGAEREVVGSNGTAPDIRANNYSNSEGKERLANTITAPATPEAQQWDGWGTALKPAVEEWWLFRKPFKGTVAGNVLAWGVGGLNVDGCRVGTEEYLGRLNHSTSTFNAKNSSPLVDNSSGKGRFPAHLTHDGSEEVLGAFPVTGPSKAGARGGTNPNPMDWGNSRHDGNTIKGHDDQGGSAARFFQSCPLGREDIEARRLFYQAKASKRDRDEGIEDGRNIHATVKSTPLMRWLCRLITPPGGVVLDPFCGSGSTGKACMFEGFRFIGIDLYQEHIDIAEARIKWALEQAQEIQERQLNLFP